VRSSPAPVSLRLQPPNPSKPLPAARLQGAAAWQLGQGCVAWQAAAHQPLALRPGAAGNAPPYIGSRPSRSGAAATTWQAPKAPLPAARQRQPCLAGSGPPPMHRGASRQAMLQGRGSRNQAWFAPKARPAARLQGARAAQQPGQASTA
jgi:hypothetical protein